MIYLVWSLTIYLSFSSATNLHARQGPPYQPGSTDYLTSTGLLRQTDLVNNQWVSLDEIVRAKKDKTELSDISCSDSSSSQTDTVKSKDGSSENLLKFIKEQNLLVVPLKDLSPTAIHTLKNMKLPNNGLIQAIPIENLDPQMPQGKRFKFKLPRWHPKLPKIPKLPKLPKLPVVIAKGSEILAQAEGLVDTLANLPAFNMPEEETPVEDLAPEMSEE